MALSIEALVRLQALDACFRDRTRDYSFEDLIERCCQALDEKIPGRKEGDSTVSDRLIRSDIAYMKKSENWGIDLLTPRYTGNRLNKKDNVISDSLSRARAYKYANQDYSIMDAPLTQDEKNLKKSLGFILDYFKNKPNSSWMTSLGPRINDELNEEDSNVIIPDYNHSEDLKGFKKYFNRLYNAIFGKLVIKLDYLPFNGKMKSWTLSPYFLKEYNNRWFLFAYNHDEKKLTNVALDRIERMEAADDKYIDSSHLEDFKDITYEQYFDDIIGVSYPKGKQMQKVVLKFSEDRYPHVKTKHLHPYQRENDTERTLTIDLVPNRELIQMILSFGKDIQVVEPESLRDEIKEIIREMSESYKI